MLQTHKIITDYNCINQNLLVHDKPFVIGFFIMTKKEYNASYYKKNRERLLQYQSEYEKANKKPTCNVSKV